ncbi:osteoclast-stimulating factor 1 [Hyalella azteca]|uniref:Osteoclast-stimulating factor 1 n=1 Tax=Hyalella azteca TaxID=294128 RepID=A0A8B7PI50_HYAAZ|nr:osteoclast-stimulating factor 1 [Hyalella azteca]
MATPTPTRVAPPPPPIRKGQVVALEAIRSYKAKQASELSIEEGDLLFILDQSNSDWWKARLDDKEGLVPSRYLSQTSCRVPIIDGARRGNVSLVRECLDAGVSTNALDKSGSSALHAAAQGGHLDCLMLILKSPGVEINLQNKLGDTPLHCAVSKGHDDVVQALLQAGADASIVNSEGRGARDLARRSSVLGLLDEAHLRQLGASERPSSYQHHEYGDNEDSD